MVVAVFSFYRFTIKFVLCENIYTYNVLTRQSITKFYLISSSSRSELKRCLPHNFLLPLFEIQDFWKRKKMNPSSKKKKCIIEICNEYQTIWHVCNDKHSNIICETMCKSLRAVLTLSVANGGKHKFNK